MALGRSAINKADGQTTTSNTATSLRKDCSNMTASATDAALQQDGITSTRVGSMPLYNLNTSRAPLHHGRGDQRPRLIPKHNEPSGGCHSPDFLIADRHFHHHVPGAFVISG